MVLLCAVTECVQASSTQRMSTEGCEHATRSYLPEGGRDKSAQLHYTQEGAAALDEHMLSTSAEMPTEGRGEEQKDVGEESHVTEEQAPAGESGEAAATEEQVD